MTETGFHLKHHLTSFQIMILGFAGVILLGALVLMLPISAAGRNFIEKSRKGECINVSDNKDSCRNSF